MPERLDSSLPGGPSLQDILSDLQDLDISENSALLANYLPVHLQDTIRALYRDLEFVVNPTDLTGYSHKLVALPAQDTIQYDLEIIPVSIEALVGVSDCLGISLNQTDGSHQTSLVLIDSYHTQDENQSLQDMNAWVRQRLSAVPATQDDLTLLISIIQAGQTILTNQVVIELPEEQINSFAYYLGLFDPQLERKFVDAVNTKDQIEIDEYHSPPAIVDQAPPAVIVDPASPDKKVPFWMNFPEIAKREAADDGGLLKPKEWTLQRLVGDMEEPMRGQLLAKLLTKDQWVMWLSGELSKQGSEALLPEIGERYQQILEQLLLGNTGETENDRYGNPN